MEKVEKELLGKIQERLNGMDSVVSRANNIHKSVKNDLGDAVTYMGRLEGEIEKTTRSKSSLRLMLTSFKSPAHIMTKKTSRHTRDKQEKGKVKQEKGKVTTNRTVD